MLSLGDTISLLNALMAMLGYSVLIVSMIAWLIPSGKKECPIMACLLTLLQGINVLLTILRSLVEDTTCFMEYHYRTYKADFQPSAGLHPWSLAHDLIPAVCRPSQELGRNEQQRGNGFLIALPHRSNLKDGLVSSSSFLRNQAVSYYLSECIDKLEARNTNLSRGPSTLNPDAKALLTCCDCGKHTIEVAQWVGNNKLNVMLHPDDTKTVIDAGWGEHHLFARRTKSSFKISANRRGTTQFFATIYSPKSTQDVEIAMKIIEAAASFVTTSRALPCQGCVDHHPREVAL